MILKDKQLKMLEPYLV